jgi:hypothetical protein
MERYFSFFRRSNRRNGKRSGRACISNGDQSNAPGDVQYTKFNMADQRLLHVFNTVLDFVFEDDEEDDLHGTDDVVTIFGPLLVKML